MRYRMLRPKLLTYLFCLFSAISLYGADQQPELSFRDGLLLLDLYQEKRVTFLEQHGFMEGWLGSKVRPITKTIDELWRKLCTQYSGGAMTDEGALALANSRITHLEKVFALTSRFAHQEGFLKDRSLGLSSYKLKVKHEAKRWQNLKAWIESQSGQERAETALMVKALVADFGNVKVLNGSEKSDVRKKKKKPVLETEDEDDEPIVAAVAGQVAPVVPLAVMNHLPIAVPVVLARSSSAASARIVPAPALMLQVAQAPAKAPISVKRTREEEQMIALQYILDSGYKSRDGWKAEDKNL